MLVRRMALVAALGTFSCVPAGLGFAADLPLPGPDAPAPALPSLLSGLYVHIGPAGLFTDAGARIATPAGRIPGATIKIQPQATAEVEVGYLITPNVGVSGSVGVPRTSFVDGAGTLGALGKLGTTLSGPATLTVHYHVTGLGRIQPYIGGGASYLVVFNSHDGALTDYQLRSAFGGVGQVGVDVMITDHLGLFVDVKKAYLRTNAYANFGPAPIRASVKLDPLAVSSGITYRF